jgi:T5SS/PEP-CTERM-associated repeat protein
MKMERVIGSLLFASAFGAMFFPQCLHSAAIWTNSESGLWRIPTNWSGGLVPGGINAGTTFITNANSKVVTIDRLTAATNLILNRMDISAPAGAKNTLFLQDVGTTNPLIIGNNRFNLYRGAALQITNSALVLTGRVTEFNVWMGDVTLDNGLIRIREEPPTSEVTIKVRIGRTNAANLTINGGLFESTALQVGETPGLQFGRSHGTVALRGGELKVHGELSIGDSASCTGVVEVTGGQLTVINNLTNITRVGDHGAGIMTVSNAVVVLNNVSIARHDAATGLLRVDSKGLVRCVDDVSIGRFSGSSGTVLVNGGHLVVTNDTIWVGREGHGELVISNGLVEAENLNVAVIPTNTASGMIRLFNGSLLVSSNFDLGDSQLASGQVVMNGGYFTVANDTQTAHSTVPSGTLTLNDGIFTTDFLFLTNANGQAVFNGGTLRTRGTIVYNGAPFVVGDGVRPANLRLLGGTHFFDQGLVISVNATLTGCGTIVGTVINQGTIATNCSEELITIISQPQSQTMTNGGQAMFTVAATGTGPLSYQWRFNGGPISGATSASLVLQDVNASMAGSYSVVVTDASQSIVSSTAVLRVLVEPQIANISFASGVAQISFPSLSGLVYVLEYKDHLDDANWTLVSSTPGTGGLLTVSDLSATVPTRFYRVRVE